MPSKQLANLLTHRVVEMLYPVEILDSVWGYFDLNWTCNRLHYSSTLVCARCCYNNISGIIISIIPVAGAVAASLGLFQTWDKTKKEVKKDPL
jgi:hypothetical protein